jgi:hypothetical protein
MDRFDDSSTSANGYRQQHSNGSVSAGAGGSSYDHNFMHSPHQDMADVPLESKPMKAISASSSSGHLSVPSSSNGGGSVGGVSGRKLKNLSGIFSFGQNKEKDKDKDKESAGSKRYSELQKHAKNGSVSSTSSSTLSPDPQPYQQSPSYHTSAASSSSYSSFSSSSQQFQSNDNDPQSPTLLGNGSPQQEEPESLDKEDTAAVHRPDGNFDQDHQHQQHHQHQYGKNSSNSDLTSPQTSPRDFDFNSLQNNAEPSTINDQTAQLSVATKKKGIIKSMKKTIKRTITGKGTPIAAATSVESASSGTLGVHGDIEGDVDGGEKQEKKKKSKKPKQRNALYGMVCSLD